MAKQDMKAALERFYGTNTPPLEAPGNQWKEYLESKWKGQRKAMQDKKLHWTRHRLFRTGHQWVSSRDGRTWREPAAEENTIRAVLNLVGPALDYRLGVLREQRPGFRYETLASSTAAREQADAQQVVVEYYFETLKMMRQFEHAFSSAQTDGVAFVHVYIDEDAGEEVEMVSLIDKTDERYRTFKALGFEPDELGLLRVPQDAEGNDLEDPNAQPFKETKGDIKCRVVMASQTLADPEAKTINGPYDAAKWFMIRRRRDIHSARIDTGNPKLQPDSSLSQKDNAALGGALGTLGMLPEWQRGLPPFPSERIQFREGVYDYLFFMAPTDIYPKGAWIRVIGDTVVDYSDELPGGIIPIARVTDGSPDLDLYPRPVMSDWIGDQVAINALLSLLLSNARIWGAGRLMVQKDTVLEETFNSVVGSLIEYSGLPPTAVQIPRTSADLWNLLTFLIKKFEDKSAWNDLARGQMSGSGSLQDVSGRALLGARELFERTLGPMVRAAADGVSEWAEVVVKMAMWFFDGNPRAFPTMGGRPDLRKRIDRAALGERPVVYADPETLIPLPRALRNQMLLDMYQNHMISLAEYKKRAPYADVRDVYAGEQQHYERAQIINEVYFDNWREFDQQIQAAMQAPSPMEQNRLLLDLYVNPSNGITVLWTDDANVHMDTLLQLICDERKPWPLRRLALDRFTIYEELQQVKMAVMGPPQIDPNTGQPIPPPPVPAEVIGAPEELQRKGATPPQPEATGVATKPPSTTVMADPYSSATVTPDISQDSASPLGEFGNVEAAAMEK